VFARNNFLVGWGVGADLETARVGQSVSPQLYRDLYRTRPYQPQLTAAKQVQLVPRSVLWISLQLIDGLAGSAKCCSLLPILHGLLTR
jgi:hypothetical protein